jgi:hypothetical protein
MDERVKFIARLLDGETMSRLCEEFEISRKTGYKILQRYRDCGVDGLTDRSRRPDRHANQLPVQIETLIVRLKREKPAWARPRSGSGSPGSTPMCTGRRSAQCMRCSTAVAWSSAARGDAIGPPERRSRPPAIRTGSGVPTTRASSCSPTGAPVIRSPSATSPAALSLLARRCTAPRRSTPSASSRAPSRPLAGRRPSGPTMACPSPAQASRLLNARQEWSARASQV